MQVLTSLIGAWEPAVWKLCCCLFCSLTFWNWLLWESWDWLQLLRCWGKFCLSMFGEFETVCGTVFVPLVFGNGNCRWLLLKGDLIIVFGICASSKEFEESANLFSLPLLLFGLNYSGHDDRLIDGLKNVVFKFVCLNFWPSRIWEKLMFIVGFSINGSGLNFLSLFCFLVSD